MYMAPTGQFQFQALWHMLQQRVTILLPDYCYKLGVVVVFETHSQLLVLLLKPGTNTSAAITARVSSPKQSLSKT
jgi:hypothetical protein